MLTLPSDLPSERGAFAFKDPLHLARGVICIQRALLVFFLFGGCGSGARGCRGSEPRVGDSGRPISPTADGQGGGAALCVPRGAAAAPGGRDVEVPHSAAATLGRVTRGNAPLLASSP